MKKPLFVFVLPLFAALGCGLIDIPSGAIQRPLSDDPIVEQAINLKADAHPTKKISEIPAGTYGIAEVRGAIYTTDGGRFDWNYINKVPGKWQEGEFRAKGQPNKETSLLPKMKDLLPTRIHYPYFFKAAAGGLTSTVPGDGWELQQQEISAEGKDYVAHNSGTPAGMPNVLNPFNLLKDPATTFRGDAVGVQNTERTILQKSESGDLIQVLYQTEIFVWVESGTVYLVTRQAATPSIEAMIVLVYRKVP